LTPYVTLDIDKIGKYRETFKSMFESIEMDFPMIRFADNFNANGLQIVKDYIEIMIKNSGMLIDNPAVA
jgi:hypothetical protein